MRMDRDKVCRNAVDRAYYDFAVQIVAQAVRDLKTARKRLKRLARKKEPLDAMAIRTVLHEGGAAYFAPKDLEKMRRLDREWHIKLGEKDELEGWLLEYSSDFSGVDGQRIIKELRRQIKL